MKKLLWASLLVLALLVSTTAPAFASGPLDGQVVFGGSFTLEAGEVLDGDLVVLGGDVTLEKGSRVDGDVAVMGGSAKVSGTVEGDIVIFGGGVELASTAVVEGNLINIGGRKDIDEGATVRGTQVEGLSFGGGFRFPTFARVWTNGYRYDWGRWLLRLLYRTFKALATVVLVTIIGALVALFLPQPLERVSQAVIVAPVHSWLIGFVTPILAALVSGALIITLCLSPFGAVILLALLITCVFGWIALGFIVGRKILGQLNVDKATPIMATIVGCAILSLITAALSIIAGGCLGWPFVVLVGSFGLGAVVLTRFGTQEYVPSPAATAAQAAQQPPVSVAADEAEFTPAESEEVEEAMPDSTDDADAPSES